MKVRDVMIPDAVSASPGMTLMAAAEMMRLLNTDLLPVVEDERLIGLVTDRDIVVRGLALGFDPRTHAISQVMTRNVPRCELGENALDVVQRMRRHHVRRLLVVDEWERLRGSVGLDELLAEPAAPREDPEIFVDSRP
ncbi:MAG: CBS domain-containing protein [Cystobacter sp.]